MSKEEVWKDVINFEGIYQISNNGRVRRITNSGFRYLSDTNIDTKGYLQCGLSKENKKTQYNIHRLVAIHFLDSPKDLDKITVNHKDGNRLNNHYTTLEWMSFSENAKHSHENGLTPYLKGENAGAAKLSKNQFKNIIRLIEQGVKGVDICRMYNIAPSTVSTIKNNPNYRKSER